MQMRLAWATLALTACTGVSSELSGETIAMVQDPSGVALGGDDLYIISRTTDDYQVLRMSTEPSTPRVIATHAVITAIVGDETGVYWLASDAGSKRVMSLPRGATTPVELFENPSFAFSYRNMVLDADYVYYSDSAANVWQVPKRGGATTVLGTTDTVAGAVAVSPEGLWVSTLAGAKRLPAGPELAIPFDEYGPDDIAWADGAVFATFSGTGGQDGVIYRVTVDGTPVKLADRLVLPNELQPYGGYLYLKTGNEDSAIRRVPYSGGGSEAVAVGVWPGGFAVDDKYVYWADQDRIRRVPL